MGFTLIEMIVVLIVISVAAAVAAPQFARFYASTKLDQAARQAVAFWNGAADRATYLRLPQCIVPDADWRTVRLYTPTHYQPGDDPASPDTAVEPVEGRLGRWPLPFGVDLVLLTHGERTYNPGSAPRLAIQPLFQPGETRLTLRDTGGNALTVDLPAGAGQATISEGYPR